MKRTVCSGFFSFPSSWSQCVVTVLLIYFWFWNCKNSGTPTSCPWEGCWKLDVAKVCHLLLQRIIHRPWCFIQKTTHVFRAISCPCRVFFFFDILNILILLAPLLITRCITKKVSSSLLSRGKLTPSILLNTDVVTLLKCVQYICLVSLKTTEESNHYWLMRKNCVQIHFHYSALVKCWHVWDFFVKNKCFFSHLKKCLLQLAWTSSFYEFSGNVSV